MTPLKELEAKMEAGEWPASGDGDDMWLKFHDAFKGHRFTWSQIDTWAYKAFRGSLDAAEALHEAVLPGWCYRVEDSWQNAKQTIVTLTLMDDRGTGPVTDVEARYYYNPARAWLLAIVRALIAQAEEEE